MGQTVQILVQIDALWITLSKVTSWRLSLSPAARVPPARRRRIFAQVARQHERDVQHLHHLLHPHVPALPPLAPLLGHFLDPPPAFDGGGGRGGGTCPRGVTDLEAADRERRQTARTE
ncbi:Hypothetical predicted protein [Cloeon dipterum]|uniref:Uncharacterized protein n=1 Tax=Cloeon dipterum TaxID=197152 RepID=A0A8S1E5S6_9INSE|nr:Hypothetical predicted protein [Cloeon dipterum]